MKRHLSLGALTWIFFLRAAHAETAALSASFDVTSNEHDTATSVALGADFFTERLALSASGRHSQSSAGAGTRHVRLGVTVLVAPLFQPGLGVSGAQTDDGLQSKGGDLSVTSTLNELWGSRRSTRITLSGSVSALSSRHTEPVYVGTAMVAVAQEAADSLTVEVEYGRTFTWTGWGRALTRRQALRVRDKLGQLYTGDTQESLGGSVELSLLRRLRVKAGIWGYRSADQWEQWAEGRASLDVTASISLAARVNCLVGNTANRGAGLDVGFQW